MATDGNPNSGQRKKRSTRMGIMLIVALVLIGIAVVWGIQRWTEEDMEGPAVQAIEPVALTYSYLAA